MKVIYEVGKIKKLIRKAVLVIGVFDGMHLGHQKLIRQACAQAKKIKGIVVVLTFHPHPVQVLRPEAYLPYIVSLSHRLKLIEEMGVHLCIVQKFTKKFAKLSPKGFVENYLMKFARPQHIIIGQDFRFGHDRGGDLTLFRKLGKKWGFQVKALASLKGKSQKIGSTLIRRQIAQGKLDQARKMMNRPVSLIGMVVPGERLGKRLGFPTANIVPNGEVLPPLGVYAVRIRFRRKAFFGMANLGRRPSFAAKGSPVTIEVHIFDFNRDIYGQNIIIEFVKKIRNEKMFSTKDALIKQLKKDEVKARSLLK